MSRKHYCVPLDADGRKAIVTVDPRNLFGRYTARLMWFVKWELLRFIRMAKGKSSPNPWAEPLKSAVLTVAGLHRELRELSEDGETQRAKIVGEIDRLGTLEIRFAERYSQEFDSLCQLRQGLVVLGTRLGITPVDMNAFATSCEDMVVVLAFWDKTTENERENSLFQRLEDFYLRCLRNLEGFSSTAECAGIRDCSFEEEEDEDDEKEPPIPNAKTPAPPMESLGNRNYRIGQKSQAVEVGEDAVLTVFFDDAAQAPGWVAIDQQFLISRSGYDTAPRILRRMRTKYEGMFAGAIDCPGKKGQGGLKIFAISRRKPRKK